MYGCETWLVTKKMENIPKGCERRMIRYMIGIKWKEAISSQEILNKCELKDFSPRIRRRLQWFGHVKKDMTMMVVQEVYKRWT